MSGPEQVDIKIVRDHLTALPEPLHREHPEALSFPMDALGPIGGSAARRMQDVIQAPDAICGQSVLAGMALAAQAHADISIDSRISPTSCFFVSVGGTGERKSGVDRFATAPHAEVEREGFNDYPELKAEYEDNLTVWKKERDDVLKDCESRRDRLDALKDIGPEPEHPLEPTRIFTEPTYEGLVKLLQISQPSVGLFSDEGGQFIGGHAMNSENALKTAAGLSQFWDNGTAKRTRAVDGNSMLFGRRLSMHLMIQPVVAERLMSSDLLKGQGLVSRMLCCWPTSTVGMRPYVETNLKADPAVMAYHTRMRELLEMPPRMVEDTRSELDPFPLEMSKGAKALWVQFHDYCDREAGAGGELEQARGLANKMAEHVVRIAAILSKVQQPDAAMISSEWIEAGIQLGNFYLSEALRMEAVGATDTDLLVAKGVIHWLKSKQLHVFYLAQVYQGGPSKVRTKKDAKRIVELLEDHRWLKRIEPVEIDGKMRRDAWRLLG